MGKRRKGHVAIVYAHTYYIMLKSEHSEALRGSPYCKIWNSKLKKKQMISEIPVCDILNSTSSINFKKKSGIFEETSSDNFTTTTTDDSDNEGMGFYSYVAMNTSVYSRNSYMSIK